MKRIVTLALFVIMCALHSVQASAATINAVSCSLSAVQAAVAAASDGDTVTIPAGTCTWDGTLVPGNKSITIQGAGQGVTNITAGSTVTTIIQWALPSSGFPRITAMTIDTGSSGPSGYGDIAMVLITGNNQSFRIDHVTSNINRMVPLLGVKQNVSGILDHAIVNVNTFVIPVNIYREAYGDIGWYGDNSWAQASTMGTADAFFVEDSTFTNGMSSQWVFALDGWSGQRVVYRKNTFNNIFVGNHGMESAGRPRGTRHWEYYDNTSNVTAFFFQSAMSTRGGTGFVFDNVVNTSGSGGVSQAFDLQTYRSNTSNTDHIYAWGSCGATTITGITRSSTTATVTTSGTDNNVHSDGTMITIASGSFAGDYFAYRVDSSHFTITVSSGLPSSAGATTFYSKFDGNSDSTGYRCADQTGAGQGAYVSGEMPPWGSGMAPYANMAQALEPIYIINNTVNGTLSAGAMVGGDSVVANRDYYNQDTGFTGATGVGRGVLASRPATCTTGVGYWATDQGEWDSTHGGNDGQFYKCTSTNTWSMTYKPYDYPHPLVSGTGSTTPTVLISTPNSVGHSEQTTSTLASIAGTCTDDVACTSVTYSVDTTGATGSAAGTSSWNKTSLSLNAGANTITITGTDGSANTSTATHQVFYQAIPGSATDAFTNPYAYGPGPLWTMIGTSGSPYVRSGGKLGNASASFDCAAFTGLPASGNNQYAEAIVSSVSSGVGYVRVAVRLSGTSSATLNGYVFSTDGGSGSGHTHIGKFINGAFDVIADVATTFTAGDKIAIQINGNTIKVFKNDVQVGVDTPSGGQITTGGYGVCMTGTATLDDFLASTLGSDTTAPVTTITVPTSSTTYGASTSPLATLSGTATDAVGVASCSWSNDRGGSGTATGTTSWSVSNISLFSGANVLTVTCRDAANNGGTDILTVTFTPAPPPPVNPIIRRGDFDQVRLGNLCTESAGSGSPEGVVTGVVCDRYLRSNGSNGTTLYYKESGSSTTGWTALGQVVTPSASVTVGTTATVTPTSLTIYLTCTDAGGCAVTLGESSVTDGRIVRFINVSANTVNFSDTSGVSELAGAFACGQWDTLTLIYVVDRWVELARSNT